MNSELMFINTRCAACGVDVTLDDHGKMRLSSGKQHWAGCEDCLWTQIIVKNAKIERLQIINRALEYKLVTEGEVLDWYEHEHERHAVDDNELPSDLVELEHTDNRASEALVIAKETP